MKQQLWNTLLGAAILSLGLGLGILGFNITQYLRENYVFNPFYFCIILGVVLFLGLSNILGSKLTK